MISNIVSGWVNFIAGNYGNLAKTRAKICSKCPNYTTGWYTSIIKDDIKEINGLLCGLCGCPLSTLLRDPKSKCKAGNW